MGKVNKNKGTQSSKRFTFSSFKDRVDSLKIEPTLKLTKRAHDYVESSHFLATLDHWREINLSQNFTDFLDEVEAISQTLPQLLHHQEKIFKSLCDHIEVNDIHSLQPLLELLAQFIHDLGSDFMIYYTQALTLLANLVVKVNPNDSQSVKNTSNILEWSFDCIAFTFKYLAKDLIKDIRSTFDILFPLLSTTKRTYISRFTGEALSYLIRRLKHEQIDFVINYTIVDKLEEIQKSKNYGESLIVVFSESIKSTKGSFHSKSTQLIPYLLDITLKDNIPEYFSVIAGIIIDLLDHGSSESCTSVYDCVLNKLQSSLNQPPKATMICQYLIILSFQDSGRKVTDWNKLLSFLSLFLDSLKESNQEISNEMMDSVVYLMCVMFRNSGVDVLTRYHKTIFESAMSLNNGSHFFSFAELGLEFAPSKIRDFGIMNNVQKFMNKSTHESNDFEKNSLFITRGSDKTLFDAGSISLSSNHITNIFNFFEETVRGDKSTTDNYNSLHIYWRLLLLTKCSSVFTEHQVVVVSQLFFYLCEVSSSAAVNETLALTLLSLERCNINESLATQIFNKIVEKFDQLKESPNFVDSLNQFIGSNSSLKPIVSKNFSYLSEALVLNISLPDHRCRLSSLRLLQRLLAFNENDSYIIDQLYIIEDTALVISMGRDIEARSRSIAAHIEAHGISNIERSIAVRHVFGQLSNKFKPSWDAAFEILRSLKSTAAHEIWSLSKEFLIHSDETSEFEVELPTSHPETLLWLSYGGKIKANMEEISANILEIYNAPTKSLGSFLRAQTPSIEYGELVRTNVLDGLKQVPSVADSHVAELIDLLIGRGSDDDTSRTNWSNKDRLKLLSLFTQLHGLRRAQKSKELYEHLLLLLTSKRSEVQKLSLNVLLNWGNTSISKYKDSLTSLLDDSLFKDELSKIFGYGNESMIQVEDYPAVMPIVLRILFGRAQGSFKSNSQTAKKFAAISILPSLPPDNIKQFIDIGASKLDYNSVFTSSVSDVDEHLLRRVAGFVTLVGEIYDVLGTGYSEVLVTTIQPLLYAQVVAQKGVEESSNGSILEKSSKNLRQSSMKCLSKLFKLTSEEYDWREEVSYIYDLVIKNRLPSFANENSQQVSSLMELMSSWASYTNTLDFMYVDDFACAKAILSLLNPGSKDSVINFVLQFCLVSLEKRNIMDDKYFEYLGIIIDLLLGGLPTILEVSTSHEVLVSASKLLLLLVEENYVDDQSIKVNLISSLTKVLDKGTDFNVDINMALFITLKNLIDSTDLSFDDIKHLYHISSKSLKFAKDIHNRRSIIGIFESFKNKNEELSQVYEVLVGLNAVSGRRMNEPDFEERLSTYKKVNESLFMKFSPLQWLPIVYNSLYYIEDEEELSLRTNAAFVLKRFVDSFSEKKTQDEADPFMKMLKSTVLPYIRVGLRKNEDVIQSEFVGVLAHIVSHAKYFKDFEDLKVLLFNDDEEANFFNNISHIQLHRRQRAIKRLGEYRNQLNPNNISQYLLPMVERYTISSEEKLRNISNEAVHTLSLLVRCVSWNQYKVLMRRYISELKRKEDFLRERVNLVVAISRSLVEATESRSADKNEDVIQNMPAQEEIDEYVVKDLIPPLANVLNVRNDETIVFRAPLAEASTCLLRCASENLTESNLPGILTSTCQVLRSRSEELRDVIRKTLSRILQILGPKYFSFVLKELKSALSRGSQIHVLSFTVHSLLVSLKDSLNHGDLDDSATNLIDVIMEDIFGAAGQEKDAEGYHSKMKEVKFKKSFDSGEILSSNVSLSTFYKLTNPINLLLKESVSLKVLNKLDELLKRYATGISRNSESSTKDILFLSYELHQSSLSSFAPEDNQKSSKSSAEDHFLVKSSSRNVKTETEYSQYSALLRKFSLEVLRTALSRNENLMTVANIQGFLEILEVDLLSENEGIVISTLKILSMIIRLPFPEETTASFKRFMRISFNIIKESPSTSSELSQACLRFLSMVLRYREDSDIKTNAIGSILLRIQADLEEPDTQGVAFRFLKAVLSQHIMIPEVYDIMSKVSEIMIVNHNKEIRDMARNLFFTFLMEYDQSRGKLDKSFKFLLNNLSYPTSDGRQSAMELINSIVVKAGSDLLNRIASSLFVGLASVIVNDESSKCREMATTIISSIISKLDDSNLKIIEDYSRLWMGQSQNILLRRCGLSVYKIYIMTKGFGAKEDYNAVALELIEQTLLQSSKEKELDMDWEMVYTSLSVFAAITSLLKKGAFTDRYQKVWKSVIDTLLFPHSWVRIVSCRLAGILLSNSQDMELTDFQYQTIGTRLLRQLSAPSISEDLATIIVKNLVLLEMRWESKGTLFVKNNDEGDTQDFKYATDYLVWRACALLRQYGLKSNYIVSTKSTIRLCAMIVQIAKPERLIELSEKILSGLYNFIDLEVKDQAETELYELSSECLKIIEDKLGTSKFTELFSKTKASIMQKRQQRRTERAQLAITAPDITAKRKLKKHERSREKRKHAKDENGLYKPKKRKL